MLFDFLETIKTEDNYFNNSSSKITKGFFSIFKGKKIDNGTLEKLEEILITSDLSVNIVNNIISYIRNNRFDKTASVEDIKNIIFEKLNNILEQVQIKKLDFNIKPYTMMFLGVNGSGKTTIIGKIANKLKENNKKVLLAAGDTFRAGAVEQLKEWSIRSKVDIILPEKENEDPAALAFKAYTKAKNENYDFLLIDTAGRLQNNINLMNELSKIDRVLKKINQNIPNQNILVLDATIGQNSLKQIEIFEKAVNINSIIMNKMDSSSKGGILISIIDKFKKPIFAIGIGENINAIKNFNNHEFLKNLLDM